MSHLGQQSASVRGIPRYLPFQNGKWTSEKSLGSFRIEDITRRQEDMNFMFEEQGILMKMDFALSLANNWPNKLAKNNIAKTSWR